MYLTILLPSTYYNCTKCRVILDLSWPKPQTPSVNGGTPRDTYPGVPKKMRLPSSVQDLANNMARAGKGAWLFSCDVACTYHQLPLYRRDWPLVCFSEGGRYYKHLKSDGDLSLLNYTTILGHECIVFVYVGQILSWLITLPLVIHVK